MQLFVRLRTCLLLFSIAMLVGALSGCGAKRLAPVDPNQPIALGRNEGLLLIHLDTNAALYMISTGQIEIGPIAPQSRSLLVLRAPEGTYRWKRVVVEDGFRSRVEFRFLKDDYTRRDELEFSVAPGAINYGGELILRYRWPHLQLRNRNHAAMAVRELIASAPRILKEFPLRFGGSSGDPFIEFYSEELDRVSSVEASRP